MPIEPKARRNFVNGASLFSLAAIVAVVGVYFIFDFYMDSLSREIMSNWIHSEAVAVEEGRLARGAGICALFAGCVAARSVVWRPCTRDRSPGRRSGRRGAQRR